MSASFYFFIQVRMGSTRFPEKVLKKFASGNSTLDIMISSLEKSKYYLNNNLVVLTSVNSKDDVLEEYCERNGLCCFRGDENNVLKRFYDASLQYRSEYIVRICGDNPFLQYSLLDQLIETVGGNPGADYYSFQKVDKTPAILTHYGFFSEIIKSSALEKAFHYTQNKMDLEHVTRVFYLNRDTFNCYFVDMPEIIDRSNIRLTFDTPDDFQIIDFILSELSEEYIAYEQLIPYLQNNLALLEKMKKTIAKNSK